MFPKTIMNHPHLHRHKEPPWHLSQQPLTIFLEELPLASRRLLMLDYDGTLAPFHVDRDRAVPYPEIMPALKALAGQEDTRLVLVSGRKVSEIQALMPLARSLEVWGGHGWERQKPNQSLERHPLPEPVRNNLQQAADQMSDLGTALEIKPASVAVHWRGKGAAEQKALGNRVLEVWLPLTDGVALEVHRFDGGLELRCQGRTKGDVVRQLLKEEPEGVLAAYLGDDMTDEDAFNALSGHGLSVLVRAEYRETAASVWLRPPGELTLFLESWRAHS